MKAPELDLYLPLPATEAKIEQHRERHDHPADRDIAHREYAKLGCSVGPYRPDVWIGAQLLVILIHRSWESHQNASAWRSWAFRYMK